MGLPSSFLLMNERSKDAIISQTWLIRSTSGEYNSPTMDKETIKAFHDYRECLYC